MPACLSVRGIRLCREMKLLHFIINIDLVDIHSKSNVCLRRKLLLYNVSLTIVHFIQESESCDVVDHPVTFLGIEIHPGRQHFNLFLTYKNSSINQLNYICKCRICHYTIITSSSVCISLRNGYMFHFPSIAHNEYVICTPFNLCIFNHMCSICYVLSLSSSSTCMCSKVDW